MTDPESTVYVSSANTKLPAFSYGDPKLWFVQVEAAFAADRITAQTTKFNKVLASLPLEVLKTVSDITSSDSNAFNALQERLITTYGDSETKRLNNLLAASHATAQKPSLLLTTLRYEATADFPTSLLKVLWMNNLPQRTKELLAASTETDLDKLSVIADRIHETAAAAINTVNDPIKQLNDQIQLLQQKINKLTERRPRSRSTSPAQQSQYRNRSTSPASRPSRQRSLSPRNTSGYCKYHEKWGKAARKCQKPCRMSGNDRK